MRNLDRLNRLSILFVIGVTIILAQQKNSAAAQCPCDIYSAGGTPCVGAFSTVRLLSSSYTGPLYQVRRTSDQSTKDIYPLSGGTVANAAAQDSFLGTGAGTISKLYDQSGKGNDIIKAPGGSESPAADNESNAKGDSVKVNGHTVFALFTQHLEGYRNNKTTGMPTGSQSQGIYEVIDGKRWDIGCCWDFGNAETNNNAGATGSMNTIFFGTGYWGKGAAPGPWFMGDFEAGVWSGGSGAYTTNNNDPTITYQYAVGMVKSQTGNYAIRVANAQSGNLITAYDGNFVTTWKMGGAIILGIGGDNSNSSYGTFFEGAITAGRPTDATDTLILKNIQAAGYGNNVSKTLNGDRNMAPPSRFNVRCNSSRSGAVISYTLQDARRVSMKIFDQQGRQISTIVDGIISAGRHEAVWDAKRIPAGVYIGRLTVDGQDGWAGKTVVGK